MKQDEQYNILRSFFVEKLNCKEDELSEDADLTFFDGYNSMLVVELILFIEENLHIEMPDEYFGLENYKTIGNIIRILNLVAKKPE